MMYLTQAVHRSVQQTPDLPATVFGGRARTWAQSAERIARLAAALRGLGVRRGDRVGILALNSDDFHEFLMAVPWADAVVVPVNTRWSAEEVAFSLIDSSVEVLFVDDTFAAFPARLRRLGVKLRAVIHAGPGELPRGAADLDELIAAHDPVPDARRSGDALAALYYTGGTTGRPKGVMLSHANLLFSALGTAATGRFVTPGGRLLHVTPMFHIGNTSAWLARNCVGGTHVILPRFSPGEVASVIDEQFVTDVHLVPTMLQMLVDSPETEHANLSSLRTVFYGASPIAQTVLERAVQRMPGAAFVQGYGMTELSPMVTVLGPADHEDVRLRRSAGRAAPHAEVRIVDEADRELPRGEVGEIVSRGGHVMLGYWNRPDETAEALRGGWMHTGDAGYVDEDGYVFVVDRIKDVIISGGENVYSVEVEDALVKHPAVAACAVVGLPDPKWGERVHAAVVLSEGQTATADDLRAHVKSVIAGYKAPRSVDFVDALPLSGAGKVLKREVRERARAAAEASPQERR